MSILAIDPGRDTGWAFLDAKGRLENCGLGPPPDPCGRPVVIERPQVYRGRSSKGDPNDLITLAIQVGEYKERVQSKGSKVELLLPHDWKGTLDPGICCHRVAYSLTSEERELVFRVLKPLASRTPMTLDQKHLMAGTRHNVLDAIGLAIWAMGPRARAAVFTRPFAVAQPLLATP